MSVIISACIWLIISILGAIFTKRLYRFTRNEYSRRNSDSFVGTALYNFDLTGIATIFWIASGLNSVVILVFNLLNVNSGTLFNLYLVSKEIISGIFACLFIYSFLYNGYYVAYAPIFVTNSTKQPLSIFILGRRIGTAKPGKRIRNNRVLPKYDKYLIEAKTIEGNLFFSKEMNKQDLDELDWRVTIN